MLHTVKISEKFKNDKNIKVTGIQIYLNYSGFLHVFIANVKPRSTHHSALPDKDDSAIV